MKNARFLMLAALGIVALCLGGLASSEAQGGLILTGKITFTNGDIYVVNLSDGRVTQLTSTRGSENNPEFSRDGTRIAFALAGIHVMNADGSGRTRLTDFGGVPAWSADGTKIAFSSNGIWVMNADGAGVTQLTNHGGFPAWSPDGTQIAFSSTGDTRGPDVWVMNADGSNARRAFSRPGADIDLAWSPFFLDGSSRLAFGGFVDARSSYEIFVAKPDGSELSRLTSSPRQDFEPTWSPDGSMIAFASFRPPSGIYVLHATGTTFIIEGRQPSWGP